MCKRILIKSIGLTFLISSVFLFTGCNILLGGKLLEFAGMEFSSQIEMIEEEFCVELDDLTDDKIKKIYSHTDPNGNDLTIQYIDLDGAGDVFENTLPSEYWTELPLSENVWAIFEKFGVNSHYDFSNIEGKYTYLGILLQGGEYDHNTENADEWYVRIIGIWNRNEEALYRISITEQTATQK